MVKKITIQHLYTTGTTAAPAASTLTLGEIAISAGKDKEGIYFKNNNDEVVKVLTSAQTRTMILETASSIEGFNEHIGHKANNKVESESNNPYGHVKLVSGDLSGKYENYNDAGDGVAASAYHFHNQYFSFLDSGKGLTTIIDNINHPNEIGISIDDTTYNKITGATPSSTFNDHTGNTEIHVTKTKQDAWDKAKSDIDAFMIAADSGNTALDTLKEIQDFLTSDDGTVQTLLENLSDLTDTVSGNTDSISGLSADVNMLKNESPNYIRSLIGDDHITASKVPGTAQQWALTHTSASTQTSVINAENTTTGLSFGSEFEIVNKIGYDKNGHVVSGSTQMLKLPTLGMASTLAVGVSKLKDGDLSNITEITNGEAAASYHYHNQYVKYNDLTNYNGDGSLVISCGTY